MPFRKVSITCVYSPRLAVCAVKAAGVASAKKAVDTMPKTVSKGKGNGNGIYKPTPPPVNLWKISAMVSNFGSSNGLGDESR